MKRREFLAGLACAGLATGSLGILGGCGGGGEGAGEGSTPIAPQASGFDFSSDIPTAPVSGRVDLSQISGNGLQVLSAHTDPALVGGNGAFTTLASAVGVQVLLVVDEAGAMRGLTATLPGQGDLGSVAVNAESTALTLALLTPGILTADPAEAAAAQAQLRSLPEFFQLVAFLTERLPVQPLSELLQSPQLEDLRSALLHVFPSPAGSARMARGETDPADTGVPRATAVRSQKIASNAPQPVTVVSPAILEPPTLTPTTPVNIQNLGLRFVNVIRQELDENGSEVTAVAANLTNVVNPFPSQPNFMAGANGVSWGSILAQQVFAGSGATNELDLSLRPQTRKLVYWIRGMGLEQTLRERAAGRHESDGPQVLSATVPASFAESGVAFDTDDFRHWFMTLTYYWVFPWMDMLTGAGGEFSTGGVALAALLYNKIGIPNAIVNLVLAIRSNPFTEDGFNNVFTACIDACHAIAVSAIDLSKQGLLTALEGGLTAGKAMKLVGFLIARLAGGIGAGFALVSEREYKKSLRGTTEVGKVLIDALGPGLHKLPPGDYLGVNAVGSVLYNAPTTGDTRRDGLFLKRFGSPPEQISQARSPAAALNTFNDVIYKDGQNGKVIFRSREGGRLTLLPPPGSSHEISGSLAGFEPRFLNDTVRAVGFFVSSSGVPDVWANGPTRLQQLETQTLSLALPARVDPLGIFSIAGFCNENLLIGNGTRRVTEPPPAPDTGPFIEINPPDSILEDLFYTYSVDTDGGPVSTTSVLVSANVTTQQYLPHPPVPELVDVNNRGHILRVIRPLNQAPLFEIVGGPALPASASVVLSINDDDEVIGLGGAGESTLFGAGGTRTIDQLVPAGFTNPGSLSWMGSGPFFRGKYALVTGGPNREPYLLAMA